MSRIPPEQIEDVRHANDIVDVIRSYINVQRAGSAFKALCPFHKEKTPSFMVNPERQIYHCFGCGAGGNVISFVMAYERVGFPEAVTMLARRAGIVLRVDDDEGPERGVKDALYQIHAGVCDLYHERLMNGADAKPVLEYLEQRKISMDAIKTFRIGFAPDAWDTVLNWAKGKYPLDVLETSGLVLKSSKPSSSGSLYDRFRCRLMFPICDVQGRPIGFSGRVLKSNDKGGKYVNSPETPLFQKSRVLYGLDVARKSIVDAGEALVCEGQIDVIRCHMAGFSSAIAAQGTAFTEDHARVVKRYADGVTIVFDSDDAGRKAALRAARVFMQAELAVRIAVLPPGQDPDSVIRESGKDAFAEITENAVSVIDFHVGILRETEDLSTEMGLLRATRAVLDLVRDVSSPVLRSRLIHRASELLGVPEEALTREFQKIVRRSLRRETPSEKPVVVSRPMKEIALLEHLVADMSPMDMVRSYLPRDMLQDADCIRILEAIDKSGDGERDLMDVVAETWPEDDAILGFCSGLMSAPPKVVSEFTTPLESVQSLILRIRIDAMKRKRKSIREKLAALTGDDDAEERKLLEAEYYQVGYDMAAHKSWAEALPVMQAESD